MILTTYLTIAATLTTVGTIGYGYARWDATFWTGSAWSSRRRRAWWTRLTLLAWIWPAVMLWLWVLIIRDALHRETPN